MEFFQTHYFLSKLPIIPQIKGFQFQEGGLLIRAKFPNWALFHLNFLSQFFSQTSFVPWFFQGLIFSQPNFPLLQTYLNHFGVGVVRSSTILLALHWPDFWPKEGLKKLLL